MSSDIHGHAKNVKKSKSYLPMVPFKGAWSILAAIDRDMHCHKRGLTSKELSDKALREFESTMIDYVDLLSQQLTEDVNQNQWSSPKNMTYYCMV